MKFPIVSVCQTGLERVSYQRTAKNGSIKLVGSTTCGKYFLLNLLELIFECSISPATGKYVWQGLDKCGVAFLKGGSQN